MGTYWEPGMTSTFTKERSLVSPSPPPQKLHLAPLFLSEILAIIAQICFKICVRAASRPQFTDAHLSGFCHIFIFPRHGRTTGTNRLRGVPRSSGAVHRPGRGHRRPGACCPAGSGMEQDISILVEKEHSIIAKFI